MLQLTKIKNSSRAVGSAKLELRDYQKEVIAQIYAFYNQRKKSVMLVSPTGSGKTLTATHMIKDAVAQGIRVLFIIHREPLVNQTVATLDNYGVDGVGYIKAGYPHANDSDRVIVASIQTLARREYPPNIGLVIFDETHTTSFYQTATNLISHYAQSPVLGLSKVKFLHLTATPFRLKKKEYFGNHIQVIVQAPHIGQLIRRGYLVTARHFGYNGLTDFSKLETGSDGDYKKSQVAVVCQQREYNEAIVNQFLDVCCDRKAISFAASVKQSVLLTELLNASGIKTEHIQAETPTEIRRAIFNRFKQGETQILSSVGTLTEGFDEPSCDAVILARPTKSLALLIQMCGRGLRLYLEKKDCYLLDFGENFKRLGRVDTKRKISLCPQPLEGTEKLKSCPNCQAQINPFCRICPECGYVFSGGDKEDDEVFIEGVFGELFDPETMGQIRYIRSQRKTRFTKGLPPDDLWELWDKKYPGKLLCNDWFYGAIFKGDRSDEAQKILKDYLLEVSPQGKPNWVKFHLALEFNNPRFRDTSKAHNVYTVPPDSAIRSWWQILQVDPLANPKAIREAYQRLAVNCQSDAQLLEQLNQAYDQGMFFREIKIQKDSREILKQSAIDYFQIIQQIDQQMERLAWSKEKGKQYLISKYQKHSRQLLTDQEIIEFLTDLSKF